MGVDKIKELATTQTGDVIEQVHEDRRRSRVTITTPTYIMTRSSPRSSKWIGFSFFFLFLVVCLFLVGAALFVMNSGYPKIIRVMCISCLMFLLFCSCTVLVVVDCMASIEEATKNTETYVLQLDKQVYDISLLGQARLQLSKEAKYGKKTIGKGN